MSQLFRAEALNSKQTQWLGDIVLLRPVTFKFMVIGALLTAAIILVFLVFGSYTQRTTVTGQLIPDAGLIKVYSMQRGIVHKKLVIEGQSVKRGDRLYVLSSERHSDAQDNILEAITRQVKLREISLREERRNTGQFHRIEKDALADKITSLENEQDKLQKLIEGQKRRVTLSEEAVARYRDLAGKGYISKEQLQGREADLLDQQNRLQAQEREFIALEGELSSQRSSLSTLASKQAIQLEQIERQLASLQQELSENEARRELIVIAPESGVATGVTVEVGQAVDINQPLLSIVPKDSRLQAVFYVPSAAVGFIKPEVPVQIRYQAFPYQKFGHATGKVISVSKTAMAANELASIGGLLNNNVTGNEPLYRIAARVDSQTVLAYGEAEPLQAGMLLEADIMRETRNLYEWVLEPLFSITGKL